MDEFDIEKDRYIPTDAEKLRRFETTIREIVGLVLTNIKSGNPELVIEDDGLQQKFVIYLDSKKMIEFDIEEFKFFFKTDRSKDFGFWSGFLEGSPEAIAELVFLEEIGKKGYATTIPRR